MNETGVKFYLLQAGDTEFFNKSLDDGASMHGWIRLMKFFNAIVRHFNYNFRVMFL